MINAQQPTDIFQYSQYHGSVIVITLDFQFRAGPVNYGSRAKSSRRLLEVMPAPSHVVYGCFCTIKAEMNRGTETI